MFLNLLYLYWLVLNQQTLTTITNAENFCVNCVHFRKNFFSLNEFGRCKLFPIDIENKADYLVSGKPGKEFRYCSTVRMDKDMCGPKGKYFQKKCNIFEEFCIKNKKIV